MMNRDITTGAVNKDGITVGKLTETVVELVAPVIVGKAAPPAKLVDDAKALFYEPKVTPVATFPKGTGVTTKYGDVWYSSRGTQQEIKLVLNHEKIHSALTPKLLFGREARIKLMTAADKSHFMKYMEEFLAETTAQVKTKGVNIKLEDLKFASKFMLNNQNYEIKINRVITEAAVGTVSIGGIDYGVYLVADNALNGKK